MPPTPDAPLPRFDLPNEEPYDPAEAAKTLERPALSTRRARRIVRKRADSTQEVEVQDILLEAYVDDPPPAHVPARPQPAVRTPSASAIPAPPRAAELAAVDDLLRRAPPPAPPPLAAFDESPASSESPSVAPVALAIAHPPAPAFVAAPMPIQPASRGGSRAALVALWGALLLVLGVAAGAAVVLALPAGAVDRARDAAQRVAQRVEPAPAKAPAPTATESPAPSEVAPSAPAAVAPSSPAPSAVASQRVAPAPSIATMSVDALPKPAVPRGYGLVTLPASADGHRVYVDDVLVQSGASPIKVKCGRRTIRIGSGGKPRPVDIPCGGELVLR